jgi:hypothetical protein
MLLSGPVADGAALHAILDETDRPGSRLLLVARTVCPCSKKKCPNHGRCRDCAAHHATKGKLPFCLRERTRWDKRCSALTAAG